MASCTLTQPRPLRVQTATITVTATDPTDHTTATQSFTVTVGAYNGPTNSVINLVPVDQPRRTDPAQQTSTVTLRHSAIRHDQCHLLLPALVSQPAHGTISQFDPTTGTLVYTPNSNYVGPDHFSTR